MLPKLTEYKVGMYLRLSKDDERSGESLSIENQRKVLTNYITEQGWTLYDEYVDDGVSGVTFERPGVQRLLDDAKAGRINLIICKDMSRLGRDYLKTGEYIEIIFPDYDVRYIAINDNVDTLKSENELMAFKNIFNDWYARDTSKKIHAVFKAKGQSGKPLSLPIYGYKASEKDKHKWIIDD